MFVVYKSVVMVTAIVQTPGNDSQGKFNVLVYKTIVMVTTIVQTQGNGSQGKFNVCSLYSVIMISNINRANSGECQSVATSIFIIKYGST